MRNNCFLTACLFFLIVVCSDFKATRVEMLLGSTQTLISFQTFIIRFGVGILAMLQLLKLLERVHDLSTIYQKCHICLEIHIYRCVKCEDLFCNIRAKNRIVGHIAIRNADFFRFIFLFYLFIHCFKRVTYLARCQKTCHQGQL